MSPKSQHLSHFSPFSPLRAFLLLSLGLGIQSVPTSARAQVRADFIYATQITQNGTQWATPSRAEGNPNCEDCACSASNSATNSTPNGDRKLTALDFQELPWDVTDGTRYIKRVTVNAQGRYNGGTGGSLDFRVIVKDDFGGIVYDSGDKHPDNQFQDNSQCQYRIPGGWREITNAIDAYGGWNAHPEWLDNIELSVWRATPFNTNTLFINAMRIHVDSEPLPQCNVSPASIDFGTTLPGVMVDRNIVITNTGGGFLNAATDIGDCSGTPFTIAAGGGPYSLGAGQSHTVTIRYAPTSYDGLSDDCSVDPNDTNDDCVDVDVTGFCADPCVVNPSEIDFGGVGVGLFSDRTFTISNQGNLPISGNVQLDCPGDPFTITMGAGGYTLQPGQSRQVTVRYAPTLEGADFCTALTGCATDVDLTGLGLGAACQVSPTNLNFGFVPAGEFEDRSFTITNTGAGLLTGQPSIEPGDQSLGFTIVSGGDPYNLGSSQSRVVVVRFTPQTGDDVFGVADPGTECDELVFLDAGSSSTGIESVAAPTTTEILMCGPNPFVTTTAIRYALSRPAHVSLDIFDSAGRRVRSLADRFETPGIRQIAWNGADDSGNRVASGSYFARLRLGDEQWVRSLVRLK